MCYAVLAVCALRAPRLFDNSVTVFWRISRPRGVRKCDEQSQIGNCRKRQSGNVLVAGDAVIRGDDQTQFSPNSAGSQEVRASMILGSASHPGFTLGWIPSALQADRSCSSGSAFPVARRVTRKRGACENATNEPNPGG